MASSTNYLTRNQFIAQKRLQQARKLGKAPPQLDQDGKQINPHMPSFISSAPWYLNQKQPSLKHQRIKVETGLLQINDLRKKGKQLFSATKITKYRKGACENCGSMSHKLKQCLQRPRAKGAKFSGKNFGRDQIEQEDNIDSKKASYDAKRDRWNGFVTQDFDQIVNQWDDFHQGDQGIQPDNKQEGEQNQLNVVKDQQYYAKLDPKVKSQTQNQRNRADVIKYIKNMDDFYDPKSRAMHASKEEMLSANRGVKQGQHLEFIEQQQFIKEANMRGNPDLNTISNPSQAQIMYKVFKDRKSKLNDEKKKKLLDLYGGEQYLKSTEQINQFNASIAEGQNISHQDQKVLGKIRKLSEQIDQPPVEKIRSVEALDQRKIPEFDKTHTSAWGSYWNQIHGWGYACCYSFTRYSQCQGEVNRKKVIFKQMEQKINKLKCMQQNQSK